MLHVITGQKATQEQPKMTVSAGKYVYDLKTF